MSLKTSTEFLYQYNPTTGHKQLAVHKSQECQKRKQKIKNEFQTVGCHLARYSVRVRSNVRTEGEQ